MLFNFCSVVSTMMALASLARAQTSTSCNPLNATCPSDTGLTSTTFSTDFTKDQNSSWTAADYTTITYSSDNGATFTVNTKADAPTIETDFYILFGYVEVKMQAAPGTGIVSSIVLLSDDLDEIDWEFLGGSPSSVQTDFFGKGNTTTYNREVTVDVSASTTTFHTYALNWTSSSLTWLIDGTAVRTLAYTDAIALGGKNYPQTPCRLKLGLWAAGASSAEGTVEWAGGATDFADAPFNMYVQSVSITNYNPAKSYTYGDETGDWSSIVIDDAGVSSGSNAGNASTSSSSSSSSTSSSASVAAASTTLTVSSTSVSAAAASASSSSSTFVQSTNGAGRQANYDLVGNKIAYFLMAGFGIFML